VLLGVHLAGFQLDDRGGALGVAATTEHDIRATTEDQCAVEEPDPHGLLGAAEESRRETPAGKRVKGLAKPLDRQPSSRGEHVVGDAESVGLVGPELHHGQEPRWRWHIERPNDECSARQGIGEPPEHQLAPVLLGRHPASAQHEPDAAPGRCEIGLVHLHGLSLGIEACSLGELLDSATQAAGQAGVDALAPSGVSQLLEQHATSRQLRTLLASKATPLSGARVGRMIADSEQPSVLVVVAHPDDVDFGAAGTVASWCSQGLDVHYCIVTDGDAGGFDRGVGRQEMAQIRRDEQRAAAKTLGVDDVTFLGFPDGRLEVTMELRRAISAEIRRVRPRRVLCQSPERNWARIPASHPDHMAAGEATLRAVYPDSRNPFAHPDLLDQGLEPHIVEELWIMAAPEADHAVDVSAFVDKKLEALRCHRSQLQDPDATEAMVRGWLAAAAERFGLEAGHLAEVFRVVTV